MKHRPFIYMLSMALGLTFALFGLQFINQPVPVRRHALSRKERQN